jgi:type II secretory pathway pseudopilin PulG
MFGPGIVELLVVLAVVAIALVVVAGILKRVK